MSQKIFFLVVLAGLMFPGTARPEGIKHPKKFGDISKRNLETNVCYLDSTAPAYYIFDWGHAYFDYNNQEMKLEYHARVKIINKNGLSYGTVTLYHPANRPIVHLRAATYNLVDGKIEVSKVDKSMIFEEKVSGSQRRLKISFPDVREGSIIEYSYRKSTGDYINLVPWYFQADIPDMYSEFNLRVPDWFHYRVIPAGYEKIDIYTTSPTMDQGSIPSTTFHWVMENIPALKEEPFMPDLDNYYSRIEFEIVSIRIPGQGNKDFLTTWQKLDDEIRSSEHIFPVLKGWGFLKDSVRVLMEGRNDEEIIQAIHDFVGRHVKWNHKNRILASGVPKKTYKNGYGNSADINLMYAGLLRLAGFVTAPVIISTRDHGIVRDYNSPVFSFYNYTMAVAQKNDKRYLLDATDPLLPARLIPANCLNGKGRAIFENGYKWIALKVPMGFDETVYSKMTIEDAGQLTGTISTSFRGFKALGIRKYIKANGEEKYIESQKKEQSQWTFSDYQIKGATDPTQPLNEKYNCTIEGNVEEMGDLLILNPLINPELSENPFKAEERLFPIDFLAPRQKRNILMYTLPEGYTVEELPASMRISTPDKNLVYTYMAKAVGENTVQIMSSLLIKKSLYPATEYKTIRKFFDELFGKQNEQIILKKTL